MATTSTESGERLQALRELSTPQVRSLLLCSGVEEMSADLFRAVDPDADWNEFVSLLLALGLAKPSKQGRISVDDELRQLVAGEARLRGIDSAKAHSELARALEVSGETLAALQHFVLAGDVAEVSRLTALHGREWAAAGNSGILLNAYKTLPSESLSSAAISFLDAAWSSLAACELDRAKASSGLARELLGARIPADLNASLELLTAFLAYERGDFIGARQAVQRVSRSGAPNSTHTLAALWVRGLIGYRLRDHSAVTNAAREARAVSEIGDLTSAVIVGTLQSMTLLMQGEISLALDAANEVLVATERLVPARHFYPLDAWLVRTAALRMLGRDDEARDSLNAWGEHVNANESPWARIEWLRAKSELAIDRGEEAEARAALGLLREAAERAFTTQDAALLIDQHEAELRIRLGDFARGAALSARSTDGPLASLVPLQVLAQTRPDIAVGRLRKVSTHGPIDGIAVELLLADLNRRLGNTREAELAVSRAFSIASARSYLAPLIHVPVELAPLVLDLAGARSDWFAERVGHGLQARLQRERGGGERPKPVSARELSIMRMLAAGMSLEEVADHLHISTDTVKSHARHVAQKVGVRTRGEAVERLRERGLL